MIWAIIFVVLGLALLFVEIFTPGGYIGAIGAGLLIGGIAGLLNPQNFWLYFSIGFLASIILTILGLSYFYKYSSRIKDIPVTADAIIGKKGIVIEEISLKEGTGKVRIDGDVWRADSEGIIPEGEEVVIEKIDGIRAIVRKGGKT